mgnify:CR=1 FL=1
MAVVNLQDLGIEGTDTKFLLLWSSKCAPEDVKTTAEDMKGRIALQLENMERLQMGK